jgi:hypothetical protein
LCFGGRSLVPAGSLRTGPFGGASSSKRAAEVL